MQVTSFRIFVATLSALVAFAANSVLCKLALGENAIDATGFTLIRLFSGALMLALLLVLTRNTKTRSRGSWQASVWLFLYAICFSFAYLSLDTGTGALILFGAVQVTLIISGFVSGTKLSRVEGFAISLAFAGLVYLMLPGVNAPSVSGFLLMGLAGIAWGFYTLLGRRASNPLTDTAFNFIRTLPLLSLLLLVNYQDISLSIPGTGYAVLSGALASGLGYTIWYYAVKGLSTTQAAVVQLLVPVLAALGGVVFANEFVSNRLLISAMMILSGILIVVLSKVTIERGLR